MRIFVAVSKLFFEMRFRSNNFKKFFISEPFELSERTWIRNVSKVSHVSKKFGEHQLFGCHGKYRNGEW